MSFNGAINNSDWQCRGPGDLSLSSACHRSGFRNAPGLASWAGTSCMESPQLALAGDARQRLQQLMQVASN